MILTPEERRAVVTLGMLLAFGQAAAWWEKWESSKPDAELSAWLTHIAEIRGGEDSSGVGQASALSASPLALLPAAQSSLRSEEGTIPGSGEASPRSASGPPARSESVPRSASGPAPRSVEPAPQEHSDSYERPPVRVRSSADIPPGVLETGKLRINDATAEQLETLPGIGPSLARRILASRRERPFSSVEDLRRVSGIGPKILERLRPQIYVAPPKSAADGLGLAPDAGASAGLAAAPGGRVAAPDSAKDGGPRAGSAKSPNAPARAQ